MRSMEGWPAKRGRGGQSGGAHINNTQSITILFKPPSLHNSLTNSRQNAILIQWHLFCNILNVITTNK